MEPVGGTATVRVERTSRSAAETRRIGEWLGRKLAAGDVVALLGDLGAGKTQLARGICRGAGVDDDDVSSPTFAIVATYRGRIPVNHADLYRIGDEDELHATGFHDLVGGPGATVVEWADRVPGALPGARLEIRLTEEPGQPSVRRIVVTGTGERHAALARALATRPSRARRP